jgi:DNA ligase 1
LFDLPNAPGTFAPGALAPGTFAERTERIEALVRKSGLRHLYALPHTRIANATALAARLKSVVAAGGKGLMLHRADAAYQTGRSGALFKFKPLEDAEAQVISHVSGRGRHAGQMGALQVRTANGVSFKLGTGFSDAQRSNPPAVGSWVTYTYRDVTPSGKPRFAAFVRVRDLP